MPINLYYNNVQTMKKIIIPSVLVLVVAFASSAYYFMGTPTYSLYKTKKAISQHDSAEFNKYVDVDRVVSDLIEQASSSLENDDAMKDNPFKNFAAAIISSMRERIKNEINKSIEEISEGKNGKFSEVKIVEIIREGKSAKVKLVNSENKEIKLNMVQSSQRYWKVVGVAFDDFKNINSIDLGGGSDQPKKEEAKKVSLNLKFGEKADMSEGWFITTQKPEQFIPASGSFDQPKKGNKFVAIEIEYSNESAKEGEVNPSNLTLKDSENHSYEMYIFGGKKPALEDDTLVTAGDKVKGFATFEVPEAAEITKAIYANSKATIVFE